MTKTPPDMVRRLQGGRSSWKCLPPRQPAGFMARPHLSLERMLMAGMDVIEVCAPHGFGKSSQLAQWYREAVVSGRKAMWISLDASDDTVTLVTHLAETTGRIGRPDIFPAGFLAWLADCPDPIQAVTAWLAEIARMDEEAILILDDVDQAGPAAKVALEYIVANAPRNLRIALSLRPNETFADSALLASTTMMRITAKELRLREDETIALVRQLARPEDHLADLDQFAIDLHSHAAGWPLGVRLAVAARLRSPGEISTSRSLADIGHYLISRVVDRQPARVAQLLTLAARFHPLHPHLLEAALGLQNVGPILKDLAAETPLIISDDAEGWFRLHPSARKALAARQAALPPDQLQAQAAAASRWYAERGLFDEAAQQAELAQDKRRAVELAEAGLRRLLSLGRNAEIVSWLERLPPDQIAERPRFWAPAGWALANTSKAREAQRFAEAIQTEQSADELDRYEADLILGSLAAHHDDLDHWDSLARRWPAPPKGADPSQMMIHSVSIAHRAIVSGKPESGRQHLNSPFVSTEMPGIAAPVSLSFVEALRGLAYLWEGKPRLAMEVLRQGLVAAEAHLDRRSRASATLAALLAEAAFAGGDSEEASRLLAQRSLIVTREAMPDAVISACTTLADIACEEGRQDRAIDRISSLLGEGVARGSLRMQAAAFCASARLHARYGRPHSAARDADSVLELCANLSDQVHPAVRAYCNLQAQLARAIACRASSNSEQIGPAIAAADLALELATRLQRGADVARSLLLRADLRDKLSDPAAHEDRSEAASICVASGLVRLQAEFESSSPLPVDGAEIRTSSRTEAKPPQYSGGLLTPREFDVACHLANHMSNKEIALAMGVGEETVKWHVKNLLQKLGASDRKTAVRRARMLGIL